MRPGRATSGDKGVLDIFADRAHMSGLANGEKRMEGRQNGVMDKGFQSSGICENSKFLMACK